MLSAILVRRANIALKNFDVYASVAGDVRVDEPGADLAIALAVAGARYDEFVDADTVVIGEIGLGGEVRQVPHAPRRLSEAMRCGFTRAIVPMSTPDVRGMQLVRVSDIREALAATPIGAG
jgi:DNA repair protein RadA/Sms